MSYRIRLFVLVLTSLTLASFAAPIAAMPGEAAAAGVTPVYVEGEVLVRIAPGTDASVLGPGASHVFGRWYVVPTNPSEDATNALSRLGAQPYVELVELNRPLRQGPMGSEALDVVAPTAVTPNDPFYSAQWHLPAIEAPEAWEAGNGSGVVVAVVDSGIAMDGEDLDCRALAGEYNAFTNSTAPGSAADDTSHGTHVAGTVGQCTNNGVGVAGVAGGASLLAVKVFQQSGGTTAELAEGIVWASTHGADVINLSVSASCTPTPPSIVFDAVDDAVAAGVVVVAASGNEADEASYSGEIRAPACHPDVIAVGATDVNDERSYYSNWGLALDVVAPGGDNRYDKDGDGYPDGVLQETFDESEPTHWSYYFFHGTSMAAPHVSGAAALVIAANPSASAEQVKKALEVTAVDQGPSGWDVEYGYGLIDVDRAIDAVLDDEAPTWPSGSTVSVVPGETSAELSWNAAADNIAVTSYAVWLDGSQVATTTSNSYTLTGLSPETSYSVAVQAADLMNNQTVVGSATSFDTSGSADTQAPHWPAGADLDPIIGDDWVYLSWSSATDNVGVATYRVLENGAVVLNTGHTYADIDGLAEGTTYTFAVEAGDAAGNWSSDGPSVVVTTEDWTFPKWSGGASMTATDVFEDRATLSWSPATDPSGIAEYDVYVGGDYHTTTATSLTVTGLDAGTEYWAWVEAKDPSGNWSMGPEVIFTTAVDFTDTGGSTFETDIAWLAGAGITKGCNPPLNTEFCPGAYVTRAQMAAFLVRAMGYADRGAGDLFVDDDGSVFEADIDRLAVAGVTRGCNPPENDMFCPTSYVTRAQMAAFLHRALSSA